MSNEITGKESVVATRRGRKKVDLSTAKVADGELKSSTSVYELLGISTHGYKTSNAAEYTMQLRGMNLLQLQEEAYARAVLPTENKDILIDRLEKKFIQETSKFKTVTGNNRNFDKSEASKEDELKNQALRVLAKGR